MTELFPLPTRQAKPRTAGLTHVLDGGMTVTELEGLLDLAGSHIDAVRLGWGSALVTDNLQSKLSLLQDRRVSVLFGGTLTELAWLHKRVNQLVDWLKSLGIVEVEVSSGTLPIPLDEKASLVQRLSADFKVYAEVGEKASDSIMAPYQWVEQTQQLLDAGADYVVCEGRGSGTAGLHRTTAETRTGLVEELTRHVDHRKLIFEAPLPAQQTHFIKRFGSDVNIGNVPPSEVISLESLRLGLRSDTLLDLHASAVTNMND